MPTTVNLGVIAGFLEMNFFTDVPPSCHWDLKLADANGYSSPNHTAPHDSRDPRAIFRPQGHLWPDRLTRQSHWPVAPSLTLNKQVEWL